MRKEVGNNFGAKEAQSQSGIDHICDKTIRRYLNKNGYFNSPLRKKGIVTAKDCKKKRSFSQKCLKKLRPDFWTNNVSFYLDGVGFTHKYNQKEEAKSSGSHCWRKLNEGLSITAKGQKEGTGRRAAHFFVGISYTRGVVLWEEYFEQINDPLFANVARKTFPDALPQSVNPKNKLILQDGDPSQNSKVAQNTFDEIGCKIFPIPARSADLNPIENMFNIVRRQLKKQAVAQKITREAFEKFSARIVETLKNFPIKIIDKTIESIPKRTKMIVKSKGKHVKY